MRDDWWDEDQRFLGRGCPLPASRPLYDGDEFHSTPQQRAHDEGRRTWLTDERDWTIEVFTRLDVYVSGADPIARLQQGHERARRTHSRWTPRRRAG